MYYLFLVLKKWDPWHLTVHDSTCGLFYEVLIRRTVERFMKDFIYSKHITFITVFIECIQNIVPSFIVCPNREEDIHQACRKAQLSKAQDTADY